MAKRKGVNCKTGGVGTVEIVCDKMHQVFQT